MVDGEVVVGEVVVGVVGGGAVAGPETVVAVDAGGCGATPVVLGDVPSGAVVTGRGGVVVIGGIVGSGPTTRVVVVAGSEALVSEGIRISGSLVDVPVVAVGAEPLSGT